MILLFILLTTSVFAKEAEKRPSYAVVGVSAGTHQYRAGDLAAGLGIDSLWRVTGSLNSTRASGELVARELRAGGDVQINESFLLRASLLYRSEPGAVRSLGIATGLDWLLPQTKFSFDNESSVSKQGDDKTTLRTFILAAEHRFIAPLALGILGSYTNSPIQGGLQTRRFGVRRSEYAAKTTLGASVSYDVIEPLTLGTGLLLSRDAAGTRSQTTSFSGQIRPQQDWSIGVDLAFAKDSDEVRDTTAGLSGGYYW
jgi:hypothetical protein